LAFILDRLAFLGVIRRRIFSHLKLMLALWAGLTLTVALVVSIPVYAESSGYRILLAALAEQAVRDPLPPFSFIYTYGGASTPSITWASYQQTNQLASNLAAAGIDLPAQRTVRYAATENLSMVFPDGAGEEVTQARLAFISGFQEQARLVAGAWPAPRLGAGPIDVLVSEQAANKLSLLVDDVYKLHATTGSRADLNLLIRVAGIWRPINPSSDFWFYAPEVFTQMIIAPEVSFAAAVDDPAVPWVHYAAWYTALDGASVRSADVPGLIDQIDQATSDIQRLLPGSTLQKSPTAALAYHRDQVRVLKVTLMLFSVPLIGLLSYFINQMAGLLIQRQQQEIAIFRSRGSSRVQVIALALGEGLALGTAALLAGVPLGLLVAQALLWTRSFLRFAPLPGPPAELLPDSLWLGALVVGLMLPAILARGVPAARRTIISAKQERTRDTRTPLWQRMGIDLLLLIPALYGYQQLRVHGMIAVPGLAIPTDDPFRNPVLLLAPALLAFALALLVLRIVPRVLTFLAWALNNVPGSTLPIALRFLARAPSAYSGTLMLIILTLSLAAFGASMARTLDQHSIDRARYSAGADIRQAYASAAKAETSIVVSGPIPSGGVSANPSAQSVDLSSPAYLSIPIEEFSKILGVRAATRVAPSNVYVAPGSGPKERGVFLGVDRLGLPEVLAESWRPDYASEPLGALMNRLADNPAAVLVSSRYAAQHGLRVGDHMTVEMSDLGATQEIPVVIAGMIDYFPTLYAENGPFLVGNLDYSFEEQGRPYPYEIWMALKPGANVNAITAEGLGYDLQPLETPAALLEADQLRPERQGLFGLLSVGFLAAVLVTMIGFLAQTLLTFQRRMVELGVLRAIGMSTRQLAWLLIYEQALVIGVGCLAGIGLGMLVSWLFLPFLQVRTGKFPDTPPFLPRIAWNQIALVCGVAGVMMLCTVGMTLVFLRRMRLFEALKLGEAV
jgi:putative ABC transport system permease protein